MPYKPKPKQTARAFQNKPREVNTNYHSSQWRNLRLLCLQACPICNDCKRELSTVADHIKPVRLGGEFWDLYNLQGLCTSCHNRKSGLEARIK